MFKTIMKQRMKSAILLFAILATTAYAIDKLPVGNPNGTSVFGGDVEIVATKKLAVDTITNVAGTWSPIGGVPVGMIAPFAGSSAPTGWLLCNGATLDSVANPEYGNLYAVITTTWGGSSATSFDVPDLQGRYLKGVGTITDGNGGVAVTLGTFQTDSTAKNGLAITGSVGVDNVTTSKTATISHSVSGTFAKNTHTHAHGSLVARANYVTTNNEVRVTSVTCGSYTSNKAGLLSALNTAGNSSQTGCVDVVGDTGNNSASASVSNGAPSGYISASNFEHSHADSFDLSGDTETRPHSYGVNYIIKY